MIGTLIGLLAAGFFFALFGATYRHRDNCHGICGACTHDCELRETDR